MGPDNSKTVQVHYYALLREVRGKESESVTTSAANTRQLYEELQGQHRFPLPAERLKVAVNDEFRDWETPLQNGDSVVFIPPVAGG